MEIRISNEGAAFPQHFDNRECLWTGLSVVVRDGTRYVLIDPTQNELDLSGMLEFDADTVSLKLRAGGHLDGWSLLRLWPGGAAVWEAAEKAPQHVAPRYKVLHDVLFHLALPQWKAKWAVKVETL